MKSECCFLDDVDIVQNAVFSGGHQIVVARMCWQIRELTCDK